MLFLSILAITSRDHLDPVDQTPSYGNPPSTSPLNTELNNVARNTDDCDRARALVAEGADLASTNGPEWRHTPLHQASYHGRYEMAKTLVELGAPLHLHSNPCGRGQHGTPLELARGGGHTRIAEMLEAAMVGTDSKAVAVATKASTSDQSWAHTVLQHLLPKSANSAGTWRKYTNIDMCFQGDVEIIHDWRSTHSIEDLKRIVEQKGYSAVVVGSFGHAALKSFDYQLEASHCAPSEGYTNDIHIWFPEGGKAKPPKEAQAPRPKLPAGFAFHDGYGEAPRADQVAHIPGIEGHCFQGDKLNWPLQWAAMIGDVSAINALVAAGHDPNVKMGSWFDSEPLGWAASFGQCKAIEALCAAGADPRRPANLAENTPLMDAQREGHSKAVALINEYLSGARPIGTFKAVTGAADWWGSLKARFTYGSNEGKADVAEATPSAAEPGSEEAGEFAFGSVTHDSFDKRGVLYAIGTNFGTATYRNPADSGKVKLRWSEDAANFYSTQGGHRVGDANQAGRVICANKHPGHHSTMWSQGQPGAWFALDLQTVSVRPTHFAYRNDYGGGGNHPRTFALQGSADGGRSWTTLWRGAGETWSGTGAKHWPITGATRFYSQFRIINQGHPFHLCCSGIELYGDVRRGGVRAIAEGEEEEEDEEEDEHEHEDEEEEEDDTSVLARRRLTKKRMEELDGAIKEMKEEGSTDPQEVKLLRKLMEKRGALKRKAREELLLD